MQPGCRTMATGVGTHGLSSHGLLRLLVAAIVAMALVVGLGGAPASSASTKACRVRDLGTGRAYTQPQATVDAAKPGARLTVRDTCVGSTVFGKMLTTMDVKTKRSGKSKLSGGNPVRVLAIGKGARVKLRGLEILHGRAFRGAGIYNRGYLILVDVQVRRNDGGEGNYRGGARASTTRAACGLMEPHASS